MAERIAASRAGSLTVYVNDRALHSRYDPQKEAETYLADLEIPTDITFFVLIEPGLGYLIPVLRRRFPGAGIIALHVSPFLAQRQEETNPGAAVWSPSGTVEDPPGLQDFLEREIPDIPATQVRIIEWRPSLEAFGDACVALLRDAVAFLKRADANARTTGYFGRRWVKNFFRNLRLIRRVVRPLPGSRDCPWIIAGAGPSLEESAGILREYPGVRVLAAASAYPALTARGIVPDLTLAADGGSWALFHLYETIRLSGSTGTEVRPDGPVLAFSLSAALPSQCAGLSLLPISDGTRWQTIVLTALGVPFISLPARGTVTALAVDLALALTGGKIVLTGTDLSHRDMLAHARPYALDRFMEEGSSRLGPVYARAFSRAAPPDASESFTVYAEWFKKQLAVWPGRVGSLGANNAVFDARKTDAVRLLTGGNREKPPRWPVAAFPGPPAISGGVEVLAAALAGPEAALLCAELSPLLFPGSPNPSPAVLANELETLTQRYTRHG